MALQTLHTPSRNKPFEYRRTDEEEIIVYPSDKDEQPQRKHAAVITHFEQQLVRDLIREAGTIVIGASRNDPARGSLGAILKVNGCSPQLLSYLSAILVREGYCKLVQLRSRPALSFNAGLAAGTLI